MRRASVPTRARMTRQQRQQIQKLPANFEKGKAVSKRILSFGILIALIAFGAGYAVAQVAMKTGRTPQFENAEVKVWRSVIAPNSPLPFHRHEHPRVLIALEGGTMKLLEDNGATETHAWESGNAYWLPANTPGTLHQGINMSDKPIVVIVVELQKAN